MKRIISFVLAAVTVICSFAGCGNKENKKDGNSTNSADTHQRSETKQVLDYISSNWDSCIKINTADSGNLIGLPYPYTVPAVGYFDEMYYWDTYFTNKGLEIDGRYEQVKNNTDNMLYLVDKYGFMPNGNRTYYLSRSQPPFLSLMVRDVYEHYGDKEWLTRAYKSLETEYKFWTEKRGSEIGLNHYDYDSSAYSYDLVSGYIKRIGHKPKGYTNEEIAREYGAVCESGWDANPRFGFETYNSAAVDLNSLLYMLEDNMAFFASELKNGESEKWTQRAADRKALMIKYMENDDGLLMDYNFVSQKQSDVFSVASIYPLFAGLADEKHAKAVVENLDRLEREYGILTCEENNVDGTFQWDAPNGWACLQYITIIGLDRYGYKEEAKRIAEKYVLLVEKSYTETANLWEKYNVVEGNVNVAGEYDMPAMMGWSAGTYLAALEYLNK